MLSFNDNDAQYIIVNGELESRDALESDGGTVTLPFEGSVVYEVIRFMGGKGLFVEDHFERLKKSFVLQDTECGIDINHFNEYASVLLSANEQTDCNLKIMTTGSDFVIYLSKKFYPGEEYYKNGVDTACIQIERPSPNAKIRRTEYIERIDEFKRTNGVFEAILMNRDGFITEGSRSNFFAVMKDRKDTVRTAPSDMVLEGVMRKYVIDICPAAGINISFEPLKYSELANAEALFLTGTSINVLPIAVLDDMKYGSSENITVRKIMNAFNDHIKEART